MNSVLYLSRWWPQLARDETERQRVLVLIGAPVIVGLLVWHAQPDERLVYPAPPATLDMEIAALEHRLDYLKCVRGDAGDYPDREILFGCNLPFLVTGLNHWRAERDRTALGLTDDEFAQAVRSDRELPRAFRDACRKVLIESDMEDVRGDYSRFERWLENASKKAAKADAQKTAQPM